MRLRRLVARGFRNLADLDCAVPSRGLALLGANAQGKTNFLEAVYYPVLFRSFRGAPDQEVAGFGSRGRALSEATAADRARGASTVGPHRDDLRLEIGGRPIREYGSTGQQRSAAVALKLLEMATLREARDTEPALLLDDVFAELADDRRRRLAARLIGPEERQVF